MIWMISPQVSSVAAGSTYPRTPSSSDNAIQFLSPGFTGSLQPLSVSAQLLEFTLSFHVSSSTLVCQSPSSTSGLRVPLSPRPSNPSAPPWLYAPLAPLWPVIPQAPPGFLVLLALPWSVVALVLLVFSYALTLIPYGSTIVLSPTGSTPVCRSPVYISAPRACGSNLALLAYGVTPGLCLLGSGSVSTTPDSTSVSWGPGFSLHRFHHGPSS